MNLLCELISISGQLRYSLICVIPCYALTMVTGWGPPKQEPHLGLLVGQARHSSLRVCAGSWKTFM